MKYFLIAISLLAFITPAPAHEEQIEARTVEELLGLRKFNIKDTICANNLNENEKQICSMLNRWFLDSYFANPDELKGSLGGGNLDGKSLSCHNYSEDEYARYLFINGNVLQFSISERLPIKIVLMWSGTYRETVSKVKWGIVTLDRATLKLDYVRDRISKQLNCTVQTLTKFQEELEGEVSKLKQKMKKNKI